MARKNQPTWVSVVIGITAVAAATGARFVLDEWLSDRVPFLTFFAAVWAAAWYGGRLAALTAMFLGGFSAIFFVMQPRLRLDLEGPEQWLTVGLYLLVSGFSAVIVHSLRNAEERAESQAKAAREKEAWLRVTLTSIGDAVITTDVEGNVTLLNPVAAELTGWTLEETVGRPLHEVFDVVDEQTREKRENPVARVLREGKVVGLANHTALLAKGGTHVRIIEDSAAPIRAGDGTLLGVVLVFRDATERAHEERARAAVQERLELALDVGKMGVWEWDLVTNDVWWSHTLEPVHGLERGAFGGTIEAFRELIHPDDRAEVMGAIERAVVERSQYAVEFRTVWPDGSTHWMSAHGRVFVDASGMPRRMVGLGVDVTERRRAAEALRATQARFVEVVDHAPAAIFVKRTDGRYEMVNALFARSAGRSAAEIVGKTDQDLFDPAVALQFAAEDREVSEGGKAVQFEESFPYAGKMLTYLTVKFPLLGDDGKVDAVCGIATDITERKRVEEALVRSELALKQADRRKDDFLATLAHELRNPLAPIRTALELMRSAHNDENRLERARAIVERQVEQMVRLIDDLLDVSRITRNKLALRTERVALQDVIQSAVETTAPIFASMNHKLAIELPAEPIFLDADFTRLAQVFGNILNNAAKYTERGGHVRLSSTVEAGRARVSVTDDGVGFSPEQGERIFEMFAQVTPALERTQGGLGIGLALSRALVEMHGGTLAAASEGLTKGSTFVITLPISENQEGPVSRAPIRRVESTSAPLRVVIADDNHDAADCLVEMLEVHGYETTAAYDGQEAVDTALALSADVVILDIGMPVLNGYEAARRLRSQPTVKRPLLVAVTGWGQEADKEASTNAGFDHHFTKPVDPDGLISLLDALPRAT